MVRNNTRSEAYYEVLLQGAGEPPAAGAGRYSIDAYLESLLDKKEYQKALDLVNEILAANPTFVAAYPKYVVLYLRRAAVLQALNKTPEAIADLDRWCWHSRLIMR